MSECMKKVLVGAMIVASGLLVVAECAEAQMKDGVRVSWDANTEPDLSGYTVKWGSVEGGAYPNSYDVSLEMYGDVIPIETGWLMPGRVYFVVTASDTAGNESGNSNEVYVDVPDGDPAIPANIQFSVTLPDGTVIEMSVSGGN